MTALVPRAAKIIFDEPASKDAFDGGGHKRSAYALADAVEQMAERNGGIGLEGKWGAGKSTVIKLAEEILKDEKSSYDRKYHMFTFDLWAHQSDDFRRAFLESFVNWLEHKKQNLLTNDEAEKERDKIRDRIKKIKTDNFKQYNLFGIIFILALPILPLAYSWLGPNAFLKNNSLSEDAQKYQTGSIYFLLLLLGAAAINVFYQYFKNDQETFIEVLSRAVSIFSKDVKDETVTQNVRETDPTTLEFHSVFRKLLLKVQCSGNRIVFVLDNIDRLPKESVRLVWSEIRSVFTNGTFEASLEEAWVTAVVPYDKEFIDDVFEVTKTKGNAQPNVNAELEGDIISKTFNRIVRVSPPIATDWRRFLDASLAYAFTPPLQEQAAFRLFNLLKHDFQQKHIHATPRRIVAYVNEISALWAQWGEEIPAESIALFTLFRSKVENNPVAIQNSDFVDKRYIRIAGVADWQKDFAALAFNVQPDLAYQTLLKQPISKALTDEESVELADLSKSLGFKEILSEVLEENVPIWIGEGSAIFSNVANNIVALELGGEVERSAWRTMAASIDQLAELNVEDEETLRGFLAIVRGQEGRSVRQTANSVRNVIYAYVNKVKDSSVKAASSWLDSIVAFGNVIAEIVGEEEKKVFLKNAQIPIGASAKEFYLGVALACSERQDVNVKDLNSNLSKEEVLAAFSTLIEKTPQEFLQILNQLSFVFDDNTRIQYLNLIGDALRKPVRPEVKDTVCLIEAFGRIYTETKVDSAHTILSNLVNDGTLTWQGYSLSLKGNGETLPILLALAVRVWGNNLAPAIPDNHAQFGNISSARQWYIDTINKSALTDDQVIKIAQFVSKNAQFSNWFEYAITDQSSNRFFVSVMKKVIELGAFDKLNVKQAVTNYPQLKQAIGEDLAFSFLRKYAAGWGEHFEKSFSDKNVLEIPNEFMVDASKLESNNLNIILGEIDKYLKSLTTENWDEALAEEGDRFRLLGVRRETGDITLAVETYRPALINHAVKVLQGEIKPSSSPEKWKNILEALKPASRKDLAEDIFNKLPSATVTTAGAENFLRFYSEVSKGMPYISDPDRALNKIFSKLIYSNSELIKEFIKGNASLIKKCLSKASDTSRDSFGEAIESLEENSSSEVKEWAKEVRQMSGLKPKKIDVPANDEETDGEDTTKETA